MDGINNKVNTVANSKPKIIVQLNGPKNATLSPPKNIFGFPEDNNDSKLIFNPTANGINPKIAAVAVKITGVI